MFSSPVVDIFMLTENHTRKDFMMLISAWSWSVMQYVGVIPGFHSLITDRASAIISSPDGCLQQVMKFLGASFFLTFVLQQNLKFVVT